MSAENYNPHLENSDETELTAEQQKIQEGRLSEEQAEDLANLMLDYLQNENIDDTGDEEGGFKMYLKTKGAEINPTKEKYEEALKIAERLMKSPEDKATEKKIEIRSQKRLQGLYEELYGPLTKEIPLDNDDGFVPLKEAAKKFKK